MSFAYYTKEVTKYPVLTKDEEYTIACRAFKGDLQAQELLVCHNLRIAIKVAGGYRHGDIEDRVQVANMGLIRASRTFNPDRQCRFYGYALRCIRGEFAHEYTGNKSSKRKINFLSDSLDSLEHEVEKVPSCLDTPDQVLQEKETHTRLLEMISRLPAPERAVLLMRYELGHAPLPLASRQWLHELEVKGLAALWRTMKRHDHTIEDFLCVN